MRPADRIKGPTNGAAIALHLRQRSLADGRSRLAHTETYRGALLDVLVTTRSNPPSVAVMVACAKRGNYLHNRRGWTAEEAAAEGRRIVDQWGDL